MQAKTSIPTSLSGLLLACALLFTPHTTLRVGEIISIGDVLFLAAALTGLVERLFAGARVHVVPVYILAGALLTISFLANYDVSLRQHDAFFFILLINAVFVPLGIMLVRLRSPAELNFIITCWAVSGAIGAGIALAHTYGLAPFIQDAFWQRVGRASGLTTHPNLLGLNCAMAAPGLLLMLFLYRSIVVRITVLLLLLVTYMAIDRTGSRSALGAFLIGVASFVGLAFVYLDIRHRFLLLVASLIVAFAAFIYVTLTSDTLAPESALGRALVADTSRSDAIRESLAAISWHDFMQSPFFGEGFHAARFAHNVYLLALHSGGVVGAAGYFITLFFPLGMLLTAKSRTSERGALIALASLSISLLVIAWWWAGYTELNISVAFALTLLTAYLYRSHSQTAQSLSRQSATEFSPAVRTDGDISELARPDTR